MRFAFFETMLPKFAKSTNVSWSLTKMNGDKDATSFDGN